MIRVGRAKAIAIGAECSLIHVIHVIVFHQYAVVSRFVRVTHHGFYLIFCAVIVAFVVAFECPSHRISVDVDGAPAIVRLRNLNTH